MHLFIIHIYMMWVWMLILLYTGGGSVEHGLDVVYHTSMRGGTPCFIILFTPYLCLKFLSPGIHKQWTIPPCLLAELFLLYTPCLSESTHLKLKQPSASEINMNVEIEFNTEKIKVPCPYIANHLCSKPGRISAKWRGKYSYSLWDIRWKKLVKLFLQPLCCITWYSSESPK